VAVAAAAAAVGKKESFPCDVDFILMLPFLRRRVLRKYAKYIWHGADGKKSFLMFVCRGHVRKISFDFSQEINVTMETTSGTIL